uniref:Thiamine diphosphokinase n=1 Tax=Steinernema glaseri TaxID=37863 RepID=A0A1I7YI29_9BILA
MAAVDLLKALRSYEKTAVLFVNGALEARRPFPDLWRRLWNGATMRVCVDGGANRLHRECREEALKLPTMVAGDLDSISEEAKTFFAEKTRIRHTHDQNETDLTKTLRLVAEDERIARQEVSSRPWIQPKRPSDGVRRASGRILGTLRPHPRLDELDARGEPPLRRASDRRRRRQPHHRAPAGPLPLGSFLTSPFQGDHTLRIDREATTGVCGFVPFCQRPTTVTTTGFRWDLEERELAFGALISTSNEVLGDSVRIRTTAPLVFTVELRGS